MREDKNKALRKFLARMSTFILPPALAKDIDANEEVQTWDEDDDGVLKGAQLVAVVGGFNAAGEFVQGGGSSSSQIPGENAGETVVQLGGIVSDTLPAETEQGKAVKLWVNKFGQLVGAGYNHATGTIDVSVINDPLVSRLGPITIIPAVSSTYATASPGFDLTGFSNMSIVINCTGTVNLTVVVYVSHDGTNWAPIETVVRNTSGSTVVLKTDIAFKYVKADVTSRTSGTVSATLYAGN